MSRKATYGGYHRKTTMAAEIAERQVWADRVRGLRQRLGMSQTRFGQAVGASITTVSHWENGVGVAAEWRPAIEALDPQ